MPATIARFLNLLAEALDRLKATTGNDPFLSQSDWRRLINQELSDADRPFFNRLIELSFLREEMINPGGRVTVSDLDHMYDYITETLLPLFVLQEGAFPPETRTVLESDLGASHAIFAEEWKIFAETPTGLSPDPLAAQIRHYLPGLLIGRNFASGGQRNLKSLFIEGADIEGELSETAFFRALNTSGDQILAGLEEGYQIERFVDGRYFLKRLPESQTQESVRFNVRKLERLMLLHLRDLRLITLFRDERSWIPFFLTGVTEEGALVGFWAEVAWS